MADQDTKYIVEGSAKIFEEGNVFYNPVQEVWCHISSFVYFDFSSPFDSSLVYGSVLRCQ